MKTNEQPLSVLYASITGGARLPRYSGRTDALYAVDRCERRIRRAVERHGGALIERANGEVMAFFNDGADALQSAIDLQHRVADLPAYAGVPMAVRVGICSGHQSTEARYFPEEGANPAASLAEIADPAHILLSIPRREKSFPWSQLAAASVPDLALNCGKRALGIFQVDWQKHDPLVLKTALVQLGNAGAQLRVRYKGRDLVLDSSRPGLTIGRQIGCDLTLRNTLCSRLHGTIERRLDRFVYVDRSTNGTYVTLEDQIEFFVRKKELLLFGHGQLSLGAPSSTKGVEIVYFQGSSFA